MQAYFDHGRYLASEPGQAADRQYLGQCYRFDPAVVRPALPDGARLASDRVWLVWWWLGASPLQQQAGAFVEIVHGTSRLLHRLIPFGGIVNGRAVRARSILHETRSSALMHAGDDLLVAAVAHPAIPPQTPLLGEAETVMRSAVLDERGGAIFDAYWRDAQVVAASECLGALLLTPLAVRAGLPPVAEALGAVRFRLRAHARAAEAVPDRTPVPRVERQAAPPGISAREYFAAALDLDAAEARRLLPPTFASIGTGPSAWLIWWRDIPSTALVESALIMPVVGPQGPGVHVVRHFGPPCSLPRLKPRLSAAPGLIVGTVHDGDELLAMAATDGADTGDTALFERIVESFRGPIYDDEGHGFLCPVWREGRPALTGAGPVKLHLGRNWSENDALPARAQAIGALSMTVRPASGGAAVN